MNKISYVAGILISFFLGGLGIHRFLAGKIGTGIIWLLTGGCFGIGALVDFIMIILKKFTNKNGEIWAQD
ncbi:MAG: TM2 domain-containing protein [Clostridia bacterium]|nr:TM2 domain-containing protein [Clostridia bacterium]